MAEEESNIIRIDGPWEFVELSNFAHTYTQAYAFVYSLTNVSDTNQYSLEIAYSSYPWRGGFSSLNFYNRLYSSIPLEHRPRIKQIQYASPGFIELGLALSAAGTLAGIIKLLTDAGERVHRLYDTIYKGAQQRRLLRLEVRGRELELKREHLEFILDASERLGGAMGIPVDRILYRTNSPFATLKTLLSFFRKVAPLSQYVEDGRVDV